MQRAAMLLIDTCLRFGSLTLLVLMGVLAFRDARHLQQGRLAVAVCLCLGAMFIHTMPPELGLPYEIKAVAWIAHMPNISLLWLFGLSLFDDQFRIKPIHWAVIASEYVALSVAQTGFTYGYDAVGIAGITAKRIINFSVLAHLLWTSLSGRGDDLIEQRRRMRYWFVAGAAVSALLVITTETLHFVLSGDPSDPDWLAALRSGTILPMILFATLWFLKMPAEAFSFESEPSKSKTAAPMIDPRDQVTYSRLVESMEETRVYREQGLSIGKLADRLNVPEHQLRALINKGLGYRNFSEFLNHYRLGDAKADLSDPEKARIPILTIAMDAGYASLATFNRAFKGAEGQTPSEFRASALNLAAAQS